MLRLSELAESIRIAASALRINLMRSVLTTAGVVVGVVLVVIMGWTIQGLDTVWEKTIGIIGRDMIYLDKWNWAGGGNWRKMRARKDITLRQAQLVKERMESAEVVIPTVRKWGGGVQYGSKTVRCGVQGATHEYGQTPAGTTYMGRWFTEIEDINAQKVIVLGWGIAQTLFPGVDPIGKEIKVAGHPFEIIGVVEKRGMMFLGFIDNQVFIPLETFQSTYGFYDRSFSVAVKAGNERLLDIVRAEAIGHMREVRNVPPGEDDDFSVNEMEAFDKQVETIRAVIWIVGIGLTLLAFVVGSIGIMNIMFVSVTERTKEIGLRKALGARKGSVLMQFLTESAFLCVIGALIALPISQIIIGAARWIIIEQIGWDWVEIVSPIIPLDLVGIAIGVSIIVGLAAGFTPALRASALDPVEALRFD